MTMRTALAGLGAAFLLASTAGCSHVDLKTALEVTDVHSGFYDSGNKNGSVHLEPSLTFRLHNKGGQSIDGVQVMVSFWRAGADGEWDSAQVKGIGSSGLAAGASTDPLVVRANAGYNLEGLRADFFSHSDFKDVTAKVFAFHGGDIVPMGEFKLDHELLMHEMVEK